MTTASLGITILVIDAATLGPELQQLLAQCGRPTPTLANHLAAITPTFTDATARTYRTYWRLAVEMLGTRPLSEVTVVDLQAVVAEAARRARQRRPDSSGRSSQETCVAALRALFSRAVAAGILAANPAVALRKPRRARSRRRALTDTELAELIDAIRATSGDPDLDLLLVRFHLETGARRQGALKLRLRDIDPNAPLFGSARRTPATANNPSPPPS